MSISGKKLFAGGVAASVLAVGAITFTRLAADDAPQLSAAPAVSETADEKGAAKVVSAGASITAPEGALPAGSVLTVVADAKPLTGLDPGVLVGSTVWTVSASKSGRNVQPREPVKIRLPLADDLGDVVIMHQHLASGPWLPLPTKTQNGFAFAETTAFSRFTTVAASAGAAAGFGADQLNDYMYGSSQPPTGCGQSPDWAVVTSPVDGMSVTSCVSSDAGPDEITVHVRSNRGLPTVLLTTYPLRATASGMGSLSSIPAAYQTVLTSLGSADGRVGAGGSVLLPAAGQVDLVLSRPTSRQPNPSLVTAEITSDPKQMHDAMTVMQVWDVVAAVTGVVPEGADVPLKSLECVKAITESQTNHELATETALCVKDAAAKDLAKYADPKSKSFRALAASIGQPAADEARKKAGRALSVLKAWALVGIVRDFGRRMGDEAAPAKTTLLFTPLKLEPKPKPTPTPSPTLAPTPPVGFGGGSGEREPALNGLPAYLIGDTGAFHCSRQMPFPADHSATSTSWLAWCDEQPKRNYQSFTRVVIDDPNYNPSTKRMVVTGTVESSYRNDFGYTIWVLHATALN